MPIKITEIEAVVTMKCADLPVHPRRYSNESMHVDRATVRLKASGKAYVTLTGVVAKKDGTRGVAHRVDDWASQETEACQAVIAAAREGLAEIERLSSQTIAELMGGEQA